MATADFFAIYYSVVVAGSLDSSLTAIWTKLTYATNTFNSTVPPIDPKLPSRRIAYLIFFVFAYIVYTFYTSNLLSNLVNDKDHDIDLDTLAKGHYECFIVDYMMLAVVERVSICSQLIWSLGGRFVGRGLLKNDDLKKFELNVTDKSFSIITQLKSLVRYDMTLRCGT